MALPGSGEVWCTSPEDIVLKKLHWFRQGGEVLTRQWDDALGVLRIFKDEMDDDYLARWAEDLKIADLVTQARRAVE